MSLIGRRFEYFPIGTYIIKSSISDELHEILLRCANKVRKNKKLKKENDYRKRLAGNLSEEYNYANAFTAQEEKIVEEELTWLASHYTKLMGDLCNKPFYRKPEELVMQKPVWVNFMKQGEWNPKHFHTGDISCVMYLKIPKEIQEENIKSKHSSKSNTPTAGKIEFCYGDDIGYTRTGTTVTPKEKVIYLFSAKLSHMVYPFKSKTERISVSVNFADKINAENSLQAKGERKI